MKSKEVKEVAGSSPAPYAKKDMKGFIKYLLIWISQNLAIPFWVVGHIHLSIHSFHDLVEILSSISMNLIVAAGFWVDYLDNKDKLNG